MRASIRGQIVGRERLVAEEVVVEAVLDRRADRHLRAGEQVLHRLGHDMRAVVADHAQAPPASSARIELHPRVGLDRPVQILKHAVDLDGQGRSWPGSCAIAAAISRPVTPRAKVRVVPSGNVITIEACTRTGTGAEAWRFMRREPGDGERVAGTGRPKRRTGDARLRSGRVRCQAGVAVLAPSRRQRDATEQLPIDRQRPGAHRFETELAADERARSRGQPQPAAFVQRQAPAPAPAASSTGSSGGTSQPVAAGMTHSARAPWLVTITGLPMACAIAASHARRHGPGRRQDDDVGEAEGRRQIGDVAGKADPLAQARLADRGHRACRRSRCASATAPASSATQSVARQARHRLQQQQMAAILRRAAPGAA